MNTIYKIIAINTTEKKQRGFLVTGEKDAQECETTPRKCSTDPLLSTTKNLRLETAPKRATDSLLKNNSADSMPSYVRSPRSHRSSPRSEQGRLYLALPKLTFAAKAAHFATKPVAASASRNAYLTDVLVVGKNHIELEQSDEKPTIASMPSGQVSIRFLDKDEKASLSIKRISTDADGVTVAKEYLRWLMSTSSEDKLNLKKIVVDATGFDLQFLIFY